MSEITSEDLAKHHGVSCPVCLEPYALDGPKRPKKLPNPCPHTLCQECVQSLPRAECPECRRAFDKDAITDNVALNHAIELMASTRSLPCERSAGGHGGSTGGASGAGAGGGGGSVRQCEEDDCDKPAEKVCIDDDEWCAAKLAYHINERVCAAASCAHPFICARQVVCGTHDSIRVRTPRQARLSQSRRPR